MLRKSGSLIWAPEAFVPLSLSTPIPSLFFPAHFSLRFPRDLNASSRLLWRAQEDDLSVTARKKDNKTKTVWFKGEKAKITVLFAISSQI